MALENNGMDTTMLVQPSGYGYGGNNGGLFGGNNDWLGILFLIALCGGGWGGFGGFGGYGAMMGGMEMYPWLNQSNQINGGFRDQMLNTTINGIQNSVTSGFGDMQTALCGGFAGVTASVNGAQNAIAQQMYANQIADMERSFAAQTANTQGLTALQAQMAQCCCDNRAATADVKYTIANEACATRATSTTNTQAILDKLCQLELDGYKRENDNLRSQLTAANLAASQTAQNTFIAQGFADEVDQLYNRLSNCPVPSTPVYGRTPIFTCTQNQANPCNCNGGFAANF